LSPLDWVVDYPAALQAGPGVVGGKGWNLARLDGLSGDISAAISDFLARTGLDKVPLAVRSSATAEDSPTTSFAGVHDSVLNVVGLETTLEAIRTCYRSVESPRARAYRERMGLREESVRCAVVLCAMLPHVVAAGVTFSAEPRTGRRDRVVVSASAGSGEALVGGRVNPEEVEVETLRYTLVRRTGPSVLSAEQYVRLARLGVRIEWALGEGQEPQDVEWVFDGQQFWVVQSRPITNLPRPEYGSRQRSPRCGRMATSKTP
jgi:pyruvate,water dikinase